MYDGIVKKSVQKMTNFWTLFLYAICEIALQLPEIVHDEAERMGLVLIGKDTSHQTKNNEAF